MKIVLIHGQAHKGSTWHIADMLLQNIECEKQVREFFFPFTAQCRRLIGALPSRKRSIGSRTAG